MKTVYLVVGPARATLLEQLRAIGQTARGVADFEDLEHLYAPDAHRGIIADLSASVEHTRDVIARIARRYREDANIVCIADTLSIPQAVSLMRAGVMDILTHGVATQKLLALVEDIDQRHELYTKREFELDQYQQDISRLTPRENEVFRLVITGLSTAEIAALLEVSTRTAENFRTNLMRKMKGRRLSTIVRLAVLTEERALRQAERSQSLRPPVD